ncbi:LytR/AlgR family response regulator transcription factor [Anaerotignum sp.]|uniref:LytR/AlgR family response regulator transcription factor n=1 Tax=Anaerotignum sp. TaxID=2039241 RepID=UPI0028AE6621|nr:LytTR family DNA-binding domain-containing protein [Anaerotignum sp.]
MFKVAICDDNEVVCSEIEKEIIEFFATESIQYDIDVFYSGEELIASLREEEKYDLIFLDIELDEINGIMVGRFIREELMDDITQISFISAQTSYALELFQVRPIHFLVKPVARSQVFQVLEKTLHLQGRQTKFLCYKSERTEKKVPYRDILYFSSEGKKIFIHTRQGDDCFYDKLCNLTIPATDFVRIHKSYIINRQYVVQFKFDRVLLSNSEELPISRMYRKDVRKQLSLWQREDL